MFVAIFVTGTRFLVEKNVNQVMPIARSGCYLCIGILIAHLKTTYRYEITGYSLTGRHQVTLCSRT